MIQRVVSVQLRMARTGLGWSVEEAAKQSGLGERTIRRIEDTDGHIAVEPDTSVERLVRCYEENGFEFRRRGDVYSVMFSQQPPRRGSRGRSATGLFGPLLNIFVVGVACLPIA